ncbi:MAG: DUF4255 domain-containing protein [Bacteroidetes bacterium]|nr:MAG: DUF4255 domain-containing protein [Bacteroidota bacterium]
MPAVKDTISDTLAILQLNLEEGLNALQPLPDDGDEDTVVIGNISQVEGNTDATPDIDNRIVITLIKTEEEYTLKNRPNHRRNPISGNLEYVNPPVMLNLYLLITPNVEDYGTALTFLSRVISFFQHQRVFTQANASVPDDPGFGISQFNFNLSMVSPSLEQLNHLWGILGGKLMPSVLYKLQLQQIEYIPDEVRPASPITEIALTERIV